MNNRIDELVEECTVIYRDGHGAYIDQLDTEKFAELIIRECVSVCLQQRDPSNLNYKPSERFAEALKQHFEVE
jgi:hypothetical protein